MAKWQRGVRGEEGGILFYTITSLIRVVVLFAFVLNSTGMSRHRNVGGLVAEAEEEFDDDYYLENDHGQLLEIGARVMARFYDEDEVDLNSLYIAMSFDEYSGIRDMLWERLLVAT